MFGENIAPFLTRPPEKKLFVSDLSPPSEENKIGGKVLSKVPELASKCRQCLILFLTLSGNFLEVSAWSSGGGLGQFSHICGPVRTELALSTYLQINYKSHKQTFHRAAKGRRKKCSCMGGSSGGTPTYAKQNIRTEKKGKANAFKILAIKTRVLICLAFCFAFCYMTC